MSLFSTNKLLQELIFTVFDTETTGLSPFKGSELLEIGAVKIVQNLELDLKCSFSSFVKPLCPIPSEISVINGITDVMVADAPLVENVLKNFAEFSGGTVLVAHNAKFDMGFIDYFMKRCCVRPKHLYVVDTVLLTKRFFPNFGRYNLDNLISKFGLNIKVEGSSRHRAVYDAVATSFVFLENIKKMQKLDIKLTLSNLIS